MNELTANNLNKTCKQILDVGIDDVETLEVLVHQVFNKAVKEPSSSSLCSHLCQQLNDKLPEFEVEDRRRITFRRLLLNKCQEEFEWMDMELDREADDKVQATEVADRLQAEQELNVRQRMLGLIQLLGHLYQYHMLTHKIIHTCIVRLLYQEQNPKLEGIECVCKLLTLVGGLIKGKHCTEKGDPDGSKALSAYMTRIEQLISESQDPRIRMSST